MAPPPPRAGRTHHDLRVHDLLLLLGTDPDDGLSEEEAVARLRRYGPNELPRPASAGPLRRLLRQMHNPLVYVLLASGTVTMLLGEVVDTAVILGVVVVNTVVGFIQESKAESALEALMSMVPTNARVVRAGRQRRIRSEGLVPGDLVVVDAGDKAPADIRLVAQVQLRVDESALTGESLPVAKDEVALPAATPVADRRNMVHAGTLVTAGSGTGMVVATGAATELGEIHRLVGGTSALATPLTRKLARFSVVLTVGILVLAALTFAIGVARGERAAEMFTAAVALAVGAIPEGLPAAVTITLAIGVARMARRRAVIRRLPAAETLGSATVICADKTGTLTENRMSVTTLWAHGREAPVAADEDRRGARSCPRRRGAALVPSRRRQLQRLAALRDGGRDRRPDRDRDARRGPGPRRGAPGASAPRHRPVQLRAPVHGHHPHRPGDRRRGGPGQGRRRNGWWGSAGPR